MTPVGHVSVSYISGRVLKNISLPAVIVGGVLPDIDFVFIFFNWFNQYHHVITHNLLFISLAAFFAFFISSGSGRKRAAYSLFLGAALHLLVDSCMDNNPTNGTGVTLLWPFYDGFFSPFNMLTASGNRAGWSEPVKMIRPMLLVVLYEVPFYIISIFLLLKSRKTSF